MKRKTEAVETYRKADKIERKKKKKWNAISFSFPIVCRFSFGRNERPMKGQIKVRERQAKGVKGQPGSRLFHMNGYFSYFSFRPGEFPLRFRIFPFPSPFCLLRYLDSWISALSAFMRAYRAFIRAYRRSWELFGILSSHRVSFVV